jgi:hypothetical protein
LVNPFIIAKAVKKELAEKIRDEVEQYHPLAKVSINKVRPPRHAQGVPLPLGKGESSDYWSVYCAGANNIAVKKNEIIKLAQEILKNSKFEVQNDG